MILGWGKAKRREGEAVGLKPFSSILQEDGCHLFSPINEPDASGFLAPPAERGGRAKWELANIQCDQRSISHPENSVPPLPGSPHQSGLMEREKKAVGLRRFLKFETPGGDLLKN